MEGSGEGEFNRPSGLTFDRDGYLLIVDGLNNRVQRYTSDGRFVGGWGGGGTVTASLTCRGGLPSTARGMCTSPTGETTESRNSTLRETSGHLGFPWPGGWRVPQAVGGSG